ncbi:hypothetical protein DSCW_32020 [Desulfosarcina widdelii]|uniref:Uncharacterized protein n=1 Tax=Desulfosarcina widdelii TaxID=947919 RepID=A0A5K7Z4Z0_9BACT|nr:hypothetical protein [Desulfosarcina widdelii]BBO75785.1 hypothetical protein DSCW_32020 [Desulfosarcina widdelii]
MTISKNYGPEIIGIIESFEAFLQKIKEDVENNAPVKPPNEKHLLSELRQAIAKTAALNKPFTYSGRKSGLFGRRDELPPEFQAFTRKKLEALAKKLLDDGQVVKRPDWGMYQEKWLDVPGGALSKGRRR